MQVGPEELAVLAAAGGAAVVQAAGTDAWTGLRSWVGRWSGRGDQRLEHAALERLDATEAALSDPTEAQAAHEQGYWSSRFEMLLELLPPAERVKAAGELESLLGGRTAARNGVLNVHVSGNASIQHGDYNITVNDNRTGA
ncbi:MULTISPECIES: hypothetical protein [unclassified Streptomyces]|uniref:hypothetical protein n=1 Tax=unclassified Streptomyces TaxID=2593676 RepID=UPI000F45427D|nr:hypothetical protein [Streptomyces sp. I6]RNL73390.1 hypothetical protein EBF04_25480 [Streptomyces sp. I6]